MKLCYKCKKRPAVVFISDPTNPSADPQGLCLMCAKESGIKPIDDMLKKMNISDEDIEQMSDQFMDIMSIAETEDGEDAFSLGTAPAFPFLNNIFGAPAKEEQTENNDSEKSDKSDKEKKKSKKRRYLDQYCINLTEKAKNGKLDNIIGRDNELYRAIQILSRRSKNNPCLIGEPGVGKTAIAEGLALKIASGEAPARLLDKEILLLDLTGLVAGTQFRGQFESRVKGLVDEIKSEGNIILFIDEIHNLVGAGDSAEGSMNAANILKPALSRGEVQVIGATTFKEYRKYIEKDAALERRFQPIIIEEPSINDSVAILKGVKSYYEGFHSVTVSDDLINKIVLLSERYVNDRFLPDKAIDLLDEACACSSLANKSVDELYAINKKIAECHIEIENLENDVENPDYEKLALQKSNLEQYKNKAELLYTPASNVEVTEMDVAKVIELWTGIPASKIQESDLVKLSNLEASIKERIIGQDEAAHLVANAVKRSRVQTTPHRRPASFIFVGPTGVGKTELVKVLSEQLFSTPETMIRLDMSEFMEKHSVSRLIGAPPGYVGYDEAGQLTEKVRRKPYSVILFDEIEKAHPDVLNILLQIFDDGRITDAQGRTVNFENTIIVMTSNAGSANKGGLVGFEKTEAEISKEKALNALREFLRPEFIARIDEIVVFAPLSLASVKGITRLMLSDFEKIMAEKNIKVDFSEAVVNHIAEISEGAKAGAREIRSNIRKYIEDKAVDIIINNCEKPLSQIRFDYNKEITVSFK